VKIDFTQPMLDMDGDIIREGERTITLGLLACRAIDGQLPGEEPATTEQKLDRWDLMLRIRNGGEVENADVKLIKDRIGRAFAPSVVGYAHKLMNGAA
jgi:hypothetical protein